MTKSILKFIFPIVFLLLWIYNILQIRSFNFLSVFFLVVLIPIVLYSLSVVSIIPKFESAKVRIITDLILSFGYSLAVFFAIGLIVSNEVVNQIKLNTAALAGKSKNLTIADINFNNDISTMLMLFLLTFVIIEIFRMIAKKMKRG
ncbi:MAG: hypothetical protein LBS33_06805 [Streptococcaceae bacterium]|nr:hypothetical protein [Streptococcaceae bacterium]